eukprot:COSAG06_NODE_2761_length_6333_cov_5.558196_1_plen_124_part_10
MQEPTEGSGLAFWTDALPYTSPVDVCAELVYSRILSTELVDGALDECGCSTLLQSEISRSALTTQQQLQGLPISCLHARLTQLLTESPTPQQRGASQPEEAEDGSVKIFPCWDATVLEGREVLM